MPDLDSNIHSVFVSDEDLQALASLFEERFKNDTEHAKAAKAMFCCLLFARQTCADEATFMQNVASVVETENEHNPPDPIDRDRQVRDELLR